MNAQYFPSPLGLLTVFADDEALRALRFSSGANADAPNALTQAACTQLRQYFSGTRTAFSLPLLPQGTPFQQCVWFALAQIPFGKVATYGQLAAAIGRPTACRAVANAVGQNPLLILLPCHRVVAADGLGGFSAGQDKKRQLLRQEGIEIAENSRFFEKFFFTFP